MSGCAPVEFAPIFEELWLATGPSTRTEYDSRRAVWHRTLKDIPAHSVAVGVQRVIEQQKWLRLPPPGVIREAALAHLASIQHAIEMHQPHVVAAWDRCPCGCGGHRWYALLRDAVTNKMRFHDETVGTSPLPGELRPAAAASVRAELEKLAGSPMIRAHLECRRFRARPLDPEPVHLTPLADVDGVPLYDPDLRSAA